MTISAGLSMCSCFGDYRRVIGHACLCPVLESCDVSRLLHIREVGSLLGAVAVTILGTICAEHSMLWLVPMYEYPRRGAAGTDNGCISRLETRGYGSSCG